jgi:hypothetical protein
MNKDSLKKYHFWILFAPYLICAVVVVIVLWTVIGPKIEAKQSEHEKAVKEAQAKKATPRVVGDYIDRLNKGFEKTRVSKWEQNWNMQVGVEVTDRGDRQQSGTNLFRWPNSPLLDGFNYTAEGKGLPFGADIPYERGELSEFKERKVYLAEYSSFPYGTLPPADRPDSGTGMADRMYPTQFNGGWTAVLRHVYTPDPTFGYGWGAGRPTAPEIWLALEDMWVQRSILSTLKVMNDRQAEFLDRDPTTGQPFPAPVQAAPAEGKGPVFPPTAIGPNHRVYRGRTWQLDLYILDRPADGKKVLAGTLSNLTNRVQMFGQGGKLTFKVWIGDGKTPVDLVFNERYLTGAGGEKKKLQGANEITVPGDSVTLPPEKGVALDKIGAATPALREAAAGQPTPVRQVFDVRTVPLQRIDKLVLGYPDSRNAGIAPKQPRFIPEDQATGGSGEGGTMPPLMGPMASSTPPPGPPGAISGPGGSLAGGGVGAGWPVLTGAVTSKTLLDVTKKRYLGDVTTQIRRMPVGMVLIIDQSNLQDLLLSLANSPLRFQITQVHWSRFRGTLGTEPGGTGGYNPLPGGGGPAMPIGIQGGGFIGTGEGGGGLRTRPFGPPGGPPGPGAVMPSPGPMMPGPGAGFAGGETPDADVQMTSGLIEVSVYGIVSLYEKYEPAADQTAATAAGTTAPK